MQDTPIYTSVLYFRRGLAHPPGSHGHPLARAHRRSSSALLQPLRNGGLIPCIWTLVNTCPLRHLQVPSFKRMLACASIPVTPIVPSPLQDLQMPSSGCATARACMIPSCSSSCTHWRRHESSQPTAGPPGALLRLRHSARCCIPFTPIGTLSICRWHF